MQLWRQGIGSKNNRLCPCIDKKVVAEGVETEEQLNFLKEYGCDEVQGYYFSKPLLAEDFAKFYKEFYKMN